jgi:hypothetical protein
MSHATFPETFPCAFLCFKEVIKLRFGAQIFLETEDPLSVDDITHFAVWIEKIAEFPRSCGTGFHTGRIFSVSHPLDTKGAFFHGALHSGSVSKIVDRGIDLLFWNVWLRPVEDPPLVGAGCDAVPAADAPVIIDHDDTIRFLPGGVDWTYFHAGGLLTLLTLDGKIDESFFGNQVRVIVMLRVLKIDQISSLESENPNPLKLRVVARVIIFFHTGVDASSTANTSGKFEPVCPKRIGNRFLGADLKFSSIFLLVSLFQL